MEDALPCDTQVFSSSVILSITQINSLLEQDVAGVQRKMEEFLHFKELQTNLKEAILLDYYVDGFCWGKEMSFTSEQLADFMGLLYLLLDNLETKKMSLEENLKDLGRLLTGIGQSHPGKKGIFTLFSVEQAKDIISYFKISLFQHYKLYQCMFSVPRDVMVLGAENMISVVKPEPTFPAPLEEGISSEIYSQYIAPPVALSPITGTENTMIDQPVEGLGGNEKTADEVDPLSGFTVEDVKTVLNQVTTEVIGSLQAEIHEKLRVQEEALTEKIENLQKSRFSY
ncbi:ciliary-associated calcium-binding coiled-coil protein 1 [Xenopus laevis]|uniref:Ciliary-associated calcium-binding coiled-coil protein 1 n=2 Tax=Xenopus laevis TaxID=8355 RepID=A0A1L8FIT8_XENLA|nr:ciliary-associated calcium-binding coiled-coil protein 1 [Xenopus laevis]OCT71499.1 hypothetical protein XELAEV_18034475mg [Xenopus laevis]